MALLRIRKVEALKGFKLRLTLTDGSVIEREVLELLDGRVFEPIRSDPAIFAEARVEDGSVVWPNGADICPDVLIWGGSPPLEADRQPPRNRRLVEGKSGQFYLVEPDLPIFTGERNGSQNGSIPTKPEFVDNRELRLVDALASHL